ncbi:MAG: ABC transporter substrate-binding protein [Candidatus Eremiobacterota bacterium]
MPVFCDKCGYQNRDSALFCKSCGIDMRDDRTLSTSSILSPGVMLDKRYEIKRLIKSGGMGAVYEALDYRFEKNPVAVKEMLSVTTDTAGQQYFIERFKKEAQILNNLRHNNLPVVKDYFVENNRYYLVMDYIEGKDLETLMRSYNKGVPEKIVVEWSKEILSALEYLHNQSPPIVYRDLKPANVMVRNSDNKIVLIDFGIARTVAPESNTVKTGIGTPSFCPVEIFQGKPEPRSDIYSLGATMHCLLTGIVPEPLCKFKPVREYNPSVSVELDLIVMKALETELDSRYVSAKEMREGLDSLKGSKGITSLPVTNTEKSPFVPPVHTEVAIRPSGSENYGVNFPPTEVSVASSNSGNTVMAVKKEEQPVKSSKSKNKFFIGLCVLLFICGLSLYYKSLPDRFYQEEKASPDNNKYNTPAGDTSQSAGSDRKETLKWLHPEVKNYLIEETDFVLTPPEAKTDGKIVRYYGIDPKGLNPLTVNDGNLAECIKNYCQESFASNHRENPLLWKPALAERIEITDDYKEYTIYLRKDVKWHNPAVDLSNPRYNWLKGEHYVTAKDVKFTIDLILNPLVECDAKRNYYKDLEYCKVIDDYTVIFKWKKKLYNSLNFTLGFAPIPEFIYGYDEDGRAYSKENVGLKFNEHWYNMKFIGCGPYEFISYTPRVSIKLARNEDYYGEKPAIKGIEWLIYGDTVQNVLKMKSKELDFVGLNSTQYREEILNGKTDSPFKNGQINHQKYLASSYSYIGWNEDNYLFSDKKVRQAMSYAFNGKDILATVFLGLGELTTGPFFIGSPAYDKSVEPYTFNLDKARKLLSEAGWKDIDEDGILENDIQGETKEFVFTLLAFGRSPEWEYTCELYKEDLLKIGVEMNIEILDWEVMQKKMEDREFDAYTGSWTLPWEQDPYQIWHSSQADVPKSSNRVGFRNKEADKLIEELKATFDMDKRINIYHKIHKIIHEEAPYTFFCSQMAVYTWQDYVKRVMFQKIRPHADSMPWFIDKK